MVVIFGDNQFKCLCDLLMRDYNVVLNTCAANKHSSIIEQDNFTIKEMARCTFASVPFRSIPDLLTAELVYLCTFWINCCCFRVGVSNTISPRELLTGIKCDYSIHGKLQFGDYLQAYCGTDNTTWERSNDCIYTHLCGNLQGGFFVYDLKTLERTHCNSGSVLPMPESIIKLAEDIARKQRCPDGLVFTLRDGT